MVWMKNCLALPELRSRCAPGAWRTQITKGLEGARKWGMTTGFQNRGATKSERLFGVMTPTALIGRRNIFKAQLGDGFNLV